MVQASLLLLLESSGAFGYLALGVLAFAGALAVERIHALGFRYSLDAPAFLDQIEKLLAAGNADRARRLCALHARSPLARVAEAAAVAHEQGEAAVRRALDWACAEQRMVVTTRVGWFKSLGVVGALLGIAGAGWAVIIAATSAPAQTPEVDLLRQVLIASSAPMVLGFSTAALCFVLHLAIASYARRMALYLEVGAKRLASLAASEGGPAGEQEGFPARSGPLRLEG